MPRGCADAAAGPPALPRYDRFMRTPLLRFLAGHLLVGVVVGWSVLGAFIALDIASLRTLIFRDQHAAIVLFAAAVFFAITFGGLAMGAGVMGLAEDGTDGGGGRRFRFRRLRRTAAAVPAMARPPRG